MLKKLAVIIIVLMSLAGCVAAIDMGPPVPVYYHSYYYHGYYYTPYPYYYGAPLHPHRFYPRPYYHR